jgi:hypothetical protein
MSLVIMFYFTSSMLNMFRTLIHPSSGACDFSIEHIIYKQKIPEQTASIETSVPTATKQLTHHTKHSSLYALINTNAKNLHLYRTHDQCGDSIEKSQAPDYGCINVRNMLSIEVVE